MSQAVLTAPLERSTSPYQRSLLSFRIRSRSSTPSCASSSLDLMATMSCSLTLLICLIIALSFRCKRWRFGVFNGHVTLAWSIALRTQELYTQPRVLKERWREERTGSSSLNFFQAVVVNNGYRETFSSPRDYGNASSIFFSDIFLCFKYVLSLVVFIVESLLETKTKNNFRSARSGCRTTYFICFFLCQNYKNMEAPVFNSENVQQNCSRIYSYTF